MAQSTHMKPAGLFHGAGKHPKEGTPCPFPQH